VDKHRIEIRNRGAKTKKLCRLQSLNSDDIRSSAALAHKTCEVNSLDYFLDALADPDFVLKIRERHPEDLVDSALRIAYT